MSLVTQLTNLVTRIGTEIKTMKTQYSGNNSGSLTGLNTTTKSSLLAAVNEVNTLASGKQANLGFTPEDTAKKGAANGYAGLDSGGTVPMTQLPSVLNRNKGFFATPTTLNTAYPSGSDGDYAVVGSTDTVWVWDSGTSAWVETDKKGQVQSVNGQTGAVVIPAVTTSADGLMSAADKTKLNGVATGATANATDAQLRDRSTHTGTQLAATISNFAATVITAVLIGLSVATNSAVVASDTILAAFGKLQAQINAHFGVGGATHPDATTSVSGFMSGADKTKLNGVAAGATANSPDATLLARPNHTGTQSADTLTDGTTNKAFLATERTKLAGIATGATANQTDAYLIARGNATGTQLASTISDFITAVGSSILTGLSVATSAVITATDTVLSALGKLQAQITAHSGSGGAAHADATTSVSGFMSGADKTKLNGVATGATANSLDATLLARANHTGTQSADTITDGTTNKAFLATERTKLAGIATAATANDTDANLKARANHTGTQLASTISDFSTAVGALSYTKTEIGDIATDFVTAFNTAIA